MPMLDVTSARTSVSAMPATSSDIRVRRRSGPTALKAVDARADDENVKDQTHTCPYCELKFDYHEEVKDHILHDHAEHADVAATVEVHELPHF